MDLLFEIGACAKLTENALLSKLQAERPEIRCINYQPGTLAEITETLNAWSQGDKRYDKLPGIFPITPYDISYPRGQELKQWKGTIIIACATEANLKRIQRENKTFGPILKPIAEEFIKRMIASKAFHAYANDISFRQIEHDYWAKSRNASQFNEYVDAIELRDLTINLSNPNCI